MGQWVSDNHTAVDAYGGSALPFASGSIDAPQAAAGAAVRVSFPYVTRFIQVFNNTTAGGSALRVGFTENGVNAIQESGQKLPNYFVIPPQESSAMLELKCTAIYLAGDTGACVVSVVAGYTAIPKNNYPLLTGSNSFQGVG
jgi:hypothetical protein